MTDTKQEVQGAAPPQSKWTTPQEVTALDMAFGGPIEKLMPPYAEVPEEFKRGHTKWNDFISNWFYGGVEDIRGFREGVDAKAALRHIGAILGSFEPKHEHKEAGCAYLAFLWFPNIEWKRSERPK